jgi:hypothetical protein
LLAFLSLTTSLLVNGESFAPFNKTDEERAKALLEQDFQPLRDLTPGGGAYINEVRHTSISLTFKVSLLTVYHRPSRSKKTGSKHFGAAITQDCSRSSAKSIQQMSFGAHLVWVMKDGKSAKMDNFARNDTIYKSSILPKISYYIWLAI